MVLDAEIQGTDLVVTGWAAIPGVSIVSVVVVLDGTAVGAAATGLPTPELPHLGPVTPRSTHAGWRARIPRESVPEGPLEIGALVVRSDSLVDDVTPIRRTFPAQVYEDVELPPDGAVLAPLPTLVRGWTVDEGIDGIEIRFGSGPPQRARLLAEARPDIAQRSSSRVAPLAGWSLVCDVPRAGSVDPVTLTVDAVAGGDRRQLTRRSVRFRAGSDQPSVDTDRLRRRADEAVQEARRHQPATDGVSLLVGTHDLGLGGGQLYLHELLRHLLRRDDVTCTVLSTRGGSLRSELEDWGATVHVVGPAPLDGAGYESYLKSTALVANTTTANVALANTTGSFWMVDLAARLGIPSLWAVHESYSLDRFVVEAHGAVDDHVRGQLEAAFGTAAAIIFEADATADILADVLPEGRSIRIDYGIDLDRIDAFRDAHDREGARQAWGYAEDHVIIVCIGTYELRKAQGLLCTAFARIAERHPTARLALVGDTGTPYAAALHELVRRHRMYDRIALLSVTPDVDPWYHLADAFILASDVESLPRSMLEAMAFELPVLGASVFGVPELVTDGVDGILFEPRSLTALTDALDRFLSMDPSARRALGRRARERVVPSRGGHRYAAEYRTLIDGLLADAGALPAALLPR